MMAICQSCTKEFYRSDDDAWKKICLSCWRLNQNKSKPKFSAQPQQTQQTQSYKEQLLTGLVQDLQRQNSALQMQVNQMRQNQVGLGADKEMLRRLIQLTHPDKHSNSEASIKAAQFLIKIKERLY